jgi:hypothetical protein
MRCIGCDFPATAADKKISKKYFFMELFIDPLLAESF